MCITSETCRAKNVIKKLALNNLHQAGPSKLMYDDAWKHKNQICVATFKHSTPCRITTEQFRRPKNVAEFLLLT